MPCSGLAGTYDGREHQCCRSFLAVHIGSMRFRTWSLWFGGALAAVEVWLLLWAWAGFRVLPKGGEVQPISYIVLSAPLLLIVAVLIAGRR